MALRFMERLSEQDVKYSTVDGERSRLRAPVLVSYEN